jgi:hypothetical protein
MLSKPIRKDQESPTPGKEAKPDRAVREWLGLRELTEYANISERTIRSWIYSPTDPLPAAKVCGKVLVRRTDFDSFLQRHRVKSLEEIDVDAIVRDVLKGASHGS